MHIPGAATLFVKFDPRYATEQIAATFIVMFYRIIIPKHTFSVALWPRYCFYGQYG